MKMLSVGAALATVLAMGAPAAAAAAATAFVEALARGVARSPLSHSAAE